MEEQRYLKIMLSAIIALVIATVVYGTFLNESSRRHIEKMQEARYTVLSATRAEYQNIRVVADLAGITVRAAWTLDVNAQYEGVIEKFNVDIGQHVESGQVLATITNNGLDAQLASSEASIAEAKASMINYEQVVERYKILLDSNAISVQEYDSAVAQRDAARAQYESRIAQRDIVQSDKEKMIITAPQAAEIIQVYRRNGDYVRAGEAVFMLADLSNLNAFAVLPHKETKILHDKSKNLFLEIPSYRLTHKIYPISGEKTPEGFAMNRFPIAFDRITPALESNASYHEVVFRVKNSTGLMEPTYYNDVKIVSVEETKVLAVPCAAIHRNGEKFFVYTLDDSDCLTKREISIGCSDDAVTEITSGLEQGTLIILTEPNEYREGTKVRVKEHEFGANLSR